MTLVDFLLARIAEDEEAARSAARDNEPVWDSYGTDGPTGLLELGVNEGGPEAAAEHFERWLPARVLAECEAKRRIVDEHTCQCPDPNCGDCGACSGDHHADPTPAPCPTLRLLAAVYVDHPDYDEAWRP